MTPIAAKALPALALAVAALTGCSQQVQVEGVKLTAPPTTASASAPPSSTPPPSSASLQPETGGGLAVRLLPSSAATGAGQPLTFTVQYVDAHGGLVGTVEDFGDGGLGGLKIADCRSSEKHPSAGSKRISHTWARPGRYTVSVTVTTLSCVHGQEDVTATATVTVR